MISSIVVFLFYFFYFIFSNIAMTMGSRESRVRLFTLPPAMEKLGAARDE